MRKKWGFMIFFVAMGLLSDCKIYSEYQQSSKQTPTFANMQNAARGIQNVIRKKGYISAEEANHILEQIGGRDEWGSRFLFESNAEPEFSFIIVSLGRDKKLDVEDIEDYFYLSNEDIVGKFDRDIVFRDGKAVTAASPK